MVPMMQLSCPWCGPRNVNEFHHDGPLHRRPDPAATTADEWRHYLYIRQNPHGVVEERWYHAAGCRKFLIVKRDTRTNTVIPAEGEPR
jgi:heterotetrameric sarcosine oxidase delta subunit